MSYLPRLAVAFLLLVIAVGVWSAGCSKPPERHGLSLKPDENPLDIALDGLRRASATSGYRDALNRLNTHISKEVRAGLELPPKTRALLRDRYLLEDDELGDLQTPSFTPVDAYHVEACYQMRQTARFLEQEGLTPLEQATRCFEWAVRQVDLHERTDDLLPPQVVLRLGQGTAAERVLIFLEALRQFQLDGCVVGLPGERADDPGPLMAGVLIPHDKKAEIHLFDPRLGRALPGPDGKGVATLAQVQKQPDLFWPAGKPAEAKPAEAKPAEAKAEFTVFLAPPLSTLSPRMRYLEGFLADRDRVYVAHDPEKLLARVEQAAGGPVRVWNRRAGAGGRPPVTAVRVLRAFLPTEEGGADRTFRMTFVQDQLSWPLAPVFANYRAVNLINRGDLAPPAVEVLAKVTKDLFAKYVHAGRDFLVRGQIAQLRQRVHILQEPLNVLELDLDQRRIDDWRQRVNQSLLRNQPLAEFANDKYFDGLLAGRADIDRKDIRDLTIIVLRALREPISQEFGYLHAQAEQEEAEQAAARKAAGKAVQGAGHIQWQEAEREWHRYVSRFGLTPEKRDVRLKILNQMLQTGEADTLLTIELFLASLRKTFAARLLLARDLDKGGKRGPAVAELQAVVADLKDLDKRDVAKTLAEFARFNQDRFWARRFEAYQKDLGPDGAFAWMRRAAELQLREWAQKT